MFKQRLGLLFIFTFMYLFINGVFRNILFFKELEFISAPVWHWFIINGVGTFRDLASFAYPVAAFALLILLPSKRIWDSKIYKGVLLLLLFLEIVFVTFQVFGEWFFWEEFNSRFNFIAVDYLIYTKELIGNIYESFPMTKLYGALFALSTLIMLLLIPFLSKIFKARENLTFVGRALLLSFCLGAPFLSFFVIEDIGLEISENQIIDQLSRNGLASFCKAFWQNSIDFEHHYKHLNQAEMMQVMEQELIENNTSLKKDATANVFIKQELQPDVSKPEVPQLNVVFIVVESLAAKFLGHYGNQQGITPKLDALIPKAMVFNNIYATGTRTVRGLEALSLSIPPTPGASMVKRPLTYPLFSMGKIMKEHSRHNQFVYGGYGYFDNMNAFFANNQFSILDRGSFASSEIQFANVWGICDGDVFKRTLIEADKDVASGRPFFKFIMTTSNHRPYTYPDGLIDLPSFESGREGAVKYTDFAIGNFLEEASKHTWYKDTLFVITGDHGVGGRGRFEIQVPEYHIPLIFFAPGHPELIPPGTVVEKLASQIDVAPTVLSLLGIHYESKFLGKNIFNMEEKDERAFLGTYQSVGMLTREGMVSLSPGKVVKTFDYNLRTKILNQAEIGASESLVRRTIAYYQYTSMILKEGLYK